MTCQQFVEQLARYLSGDLPRDANGEAEIHLEVCPDCVRYLESYRVTIDVAKAAKDDDASLPEDLVRVVVSAKRRE